MKFNAIAKNRSLAIAFMFGIINKQKKLQMHLKRDIKSSLKLKRKKFKAKRFFRRLEKICDKFLMDHEDEKLFVKDLQNAYTTCTLTQ
jgi:hypothetical protein